MIRTILLILILFVWFLLGFLFWPVIWVSGLFSRKAADRVAFFFIHAGCCIARFVAGIRLSVTGRENIPQGAALYIVNHRSIFDIVVLYSLFREPTGFIGKDSLAKIPVFNYWMTLNRGLFLNRSDIREGMKTILKGIENLKEGVPMVIFPEGTRNRGEEGSLLEFHAGSFKLAEKTNVPIIPIGITHTADCFENHKPWLKAANVSVTVLPGYRYADFPKEEQRQIWKITQDKIQKVLDEKTEKR